MQCEAIIHALYAGVLDPAQWASALQKMRSLTRSEQTTFLVWDNRFNRTAIAEVANLDLPTMEDYENNFAAIDPGKPAVDRTPLGTWYIDARDLGLATIRTHDFYQDFMRNHGMGSIMCTPLLRSATTLAGLSFQTGYGQPHFQAEDAARLAPVMPHLLRATALRWRFREVSRLAQLGQQVLDHLQSPVLVVDDQAHVLFANHAGQQWLLETQQPFSQQGMGKQSAIGAQLRRLAKQICGTLAQEPVAAGLMLDASIAGTPTYLVGVPLCDSHPLAQQWSEPVGIIVVHALAAQPVPWAHLTRQLFGLTPAEMRLLEVLPEHDALQDAATALGLRRETVRSQLSSIFQKTGMHTQAALARLMTQFSQIQ